MAYPDQAVVWDHIRRRFGEQYDLSVDRLLPSLREEKHGVDRNWVVGLLKSYAAQGLGTFYTGRRRHPTRISWRRKPSEVTGPVVTSGNSERQPAKMLEHPLPLRPGLTAKLVLPEDLTSAEAARLVEFVKLLPVFPQPAAA